MAATLRLFLLLTLSWLISHVVGIVVVRNTGTTPQHLITTVGVHGTTYWGCDLLIPLLVAVVVIRRVGLGTAGLALALSYLATAVAISIASKPGILGLRASEWYLIQMLAVIAVLCGFAFLLLRLVSRTR